jgi:hypothetical protein
MSTPAQPSGLPESEQDQITLNIAAVQEFYVREDGKLNRSQRLLGRCSEMVGQPLFWSLT